MPTEVTSLIETHISAAVAVLTRAFADDPGLHVVLPDAADRARLNAQLAEAAVRYTIRCGAPLVTSGAVRGVAQWFPPDAAAPTPEDFAETGKRQCQDCWAMPRGHASPA